MSNVYLYLSHLVAFSDCCVFLSVCFFSGHSNFGGVSDNVNIRPFYHSFLAQFQKIHVFLTRFYQILFQVKKRTTRYFVYLDI
jgi:hypothetical protein